MPILKDLPFSATALVIAAHPDDEMLGCGGTLARLAANGCGITILLLGEGPTSRDSTAIASSAAKDQARSSALLAARELNIDNVQFGNLPDNQFDSIPLLKLIQPIEKIAALVKPDIVFTHHPGDLNVDHERTHRAVMTAFRPLPGSRVKAILGFEVLSSTEYNTPGSTAHFSPNVYSNISEFLMKKQEALTHYASEMRSWPHPRSTEGVEHLARLRGCQCGHEAAEAFMLCRCVL